MGVHLHDETLTDRAKMLAVRSMLKLGPALSGTEADRATYDSMLSSKVSPADGVTYEPAVLNDVQGWWCHPAERGAGKILYLHGGAYVLGAAWAYRNFVGQIAARARASAFVPDYALAPERPFPAALKDAVSVYAALSKEPGPVAVVGDSAGGGLGLGLLSHIAHGQGGAPLVQPACAVLLSPWADLSLSGASIEDRVDRDPLLTRPALATAAMLYLGGLPATDPRASTLMGDLSSLPPVMIHAGDDEILLDDSRRIDAIIETTGGQVETHVWMGMIHVFPTSFSQLDAAAEALATSCDFIRLHLNGLGVSVK